MADTALRYTDGGQSFFSQIICLGNDMYVYIFHDEEISSMNSILTFHTDILISVDELIEESHTQREHASCLRGW